MNHPKQLRGTENQNPAELGFCALVKEDFKTHGSMFMEQGFWAIAVHRFGNWRMSIKPKLIRAPMSLIYNFLFRWIEWTCGISLPYTVKLGRRVRIWHHSGMILNAMSIGDDVQIRQNTTFGVVRTNANYELPTIGNGVDIGCGVSILGRISVGDNSIIGANAVVLKDVPPNSLAVGIPARILPRLSEQKP